MAPGISVVGRLVALAVCVTLATVASALDRPVPPPEKPVDALLVLPGFGYSRAGEKALRALTNSMAAEGMELFMPDYLSRAGLVESRANLQRFIRDRGLARYARVHVFAFIAGAWTLNPLVEMRGLPNLATIVYDRSPYQERAPRIADETLHFLTWVRYGSPVFDLARTPYPPLTASDVRVGLVVETTPTAFVKEHEREARSYGPFHFECDAYLQRHDDCLFLPLNHDELYMRFAEVWPEWLTFIRTGHFTGAANRMPPTGDALAGDRSRR